MNKIKEFLDRASKAYYDGNPMITDEVFDRLADSIGYSKVGAKQHEDVEKHYYPMFSLQKYYENEDMKNPLEGMACSMTLKLDGAAVSILYINGMLSRVLTRGDGIEGKLITDKFLLTELVPKKISLPGIVQITGEVVAPKHIENARNYAAGSLNLKDINEFKTRAVEFFAYGLQCSTESGYLYDTYEQDMTQLRREGFNTIYGEYELDKIYPCDGLVFRVNSNKTFKDLGFTSKHPRGAYARKERPEGAITTLLNVEWQVGKSGKVTPVAILDPVMLGDATISRATLNNPGFIEMLDLQLGDQVHVVRAGEIIPCITHKVEG